MKQQYVAEFYKQISCYVYFNKVIIYLLGGIYIIKNLQISFLKPMSILTHISLLVIKENCFKMNGKKS